MHQLEAEISELDIEECKNFLDEMGMENQDWIE